MLFYNACFLKITRDKNSVQLRKTIEMVSNNPTQRFVMHSRGLQLPLKTKITKMGSQTLMCVPKIENWNPIAMYAIKHHTNIKKRVVKFTALPQDCHTFEFLSSQLWSSRKRSLDVTLQALVILSMVMKINATLIPCEKLKLNKVHQRKI